MSSSMQAQHMPGPQQLQQQQQYQGQQQLQPQQQQQQQQQIVMGPQGAYTITDASACNLQQQQLVLLQAGQATTGFPVAGGMGTVMGGALHSPLAVSHAANTQGGHVPMCMGLQIQPQQLQMQPQQLQVQVQGQVPTQYNSPGTPQQPVYMWMQVPVTSLSSGGDCSAPVPLAALGAPTQQMGLQPAGMTSIVTPCDASVVSQGLTYTCVMPQQQQLQQTGSTGFVQSPQMAQVVGNPGAFMTGSSSSGSTGFNTGEVVGAVQYTAGGTPGGTVTWQYVQQPVMGVDMGGMQQMQDVSQLQVGMQCLSAGPGLSVGPGPGL
jgi:hypothetical protein